MLSKCLSGLTPENTVAWQQITEMVIILFSFFSVLFDISECFFSLMPNTNFYEGEKMRCESTTL